MTPDKLALTLPQEGVQNGHLAEARGRPLAFDDVAVRVARGAVVLHMLLTTCGLTSQYITRDKMWKRQQDNDTMPDISPRHEAAATLAHAGIPVFPCLINDKKPVGWLAPNGLKDRTTDTNVIAKWWGQGDWNLAVVPNDLGCYVVDIDAKRDGLTTWLALCQEQGWEPAAPLVVCTPSGGWHLYYKGSHANSVGTPRRGLGPGIDIRGREGYVLVPPSVINGVGYTYHT